MEIFIESIVLVTLGFLPMLGSMEVACRLGKRRRIRRERAFPAFADYYKLTIKEVYIYNE